MRPWTIAAAFACLLFGVAACGDGDSKVDPNTVFGTPQDGGTGGSTSTTSFCAGYCKGLVNNAAGCEHYNDGQRCEAICGFYAQSGCKTTWEAFASCMQVSQSAECFQPDAGKLTLVISDCHDEFDAWDQCREERDAGICPY